MKSTDLQIYQIKTSFKILMHIAAWIFLIATLSSACLPLISETDTTDPDRIYAITSVLFLILGAVSIYLFYVIKQFPNSSVAIDVDGVWPGHLGKKDSLIPWKAIEDIKERSFGQRLELIGRGRVLMRVEYQLADFSDLRSILVEKADLNKTNYFPLTYAKPEFYHIFNVSAQIGFAALGWYGGKFEPLWSHLSMSVLVAVIAYEYITTPCGLTVNQNEQTVRYPFSSRIVQTGHITDIKLSDTVVKGDSYPEVHIITNSASKPIKLKNLGIDAVKLYKILTQVKGKDIR